MRAATTDELSSLGLSTDSIGGGFVVAMIDDTELSTDGTLTDTAIPVGHEGGSTGLSEVDLDKIDVDKSEVELSEPGEGTVKMNEPSSCALVAAWDEVCEVVEVESDDFDST